MMNVNHTYIMSLKTQKGALHKEFSSYLVVAGYSLVDFIICTILAHMVCDFFRSVEYVNSVFLFVCYVCKIRESGKTLLTSLIFHWLQHIRLIFVSLSFILYSMPSLCQLFDPPALFFFYQMISIIVVYSTMCVHFKILT